MEWLTPKKGSPVFHFSLTAANGYLAMRYHSG